MTAPLLQVRDLHIDFAEPRPAVNGIGFDVHAGEVVALVGESGSGKSMTARAVLGLLPASAQARGSILLEGEELLAMDDAGLSRIRGARVSLVFQEPQSALNPVRRVSWQIRQALTAHGDISRGRARARAVELLRDVEMPDPEKRVDYYPHQLSGGQKQRVAIALALANDPQLLIADEPTTALDVTVQAEILALLGRIRDRTGMAILLITHNMGVVAQHADRVLVLSRGDVVETGETLALFADPQHAYTRQLLAAVPQLPAVVDEAVAPARPEEPAVLAWEHVAVEFPGRRGQEAFRAVEDVTLEVRRGEVLGLVGESGSGKTTLGRVAAGLVTPTTGRVLVDGHELGLLGEAQLRQTRRHLAFVHQDPASSLDPRQSVGTSIREPMDIHGVGSSADRHARVEELLDAVRLPASLARRLPHQLSGGQRQRVALARALALEPRLVIADEPTSALDVSVQAEVLELFTALQTRLGFACVFISHDLAVVQQISHRVAVLRRGAVVEEGETSSVFGRAQHEYTRSLIRAIPAPDPSTRVSRVAAGARS